MDDDKVLLTRKQAAFMLGCTTRTLLDWEKLPDDPLEPHSRAHGSHGGVKYDAHDLHSWALRKRLSDMGIDGSQAYVFETERARKTHHEANLASIEEERQRGNVIPADVVIETWCDRAAAMKSRLLSLPTKMAYQLSTISDLKTIESILRTQVTEALQELSEGSQLNAYGIERIQDSAAESTDCA